MKNNLVFFWLLIFVCAVMGAFFWRMSAGHWGRQKTSGDFSNYTVTIPRLIEYQENDPFYEYNFNVSKGVKILTLQNFSCSDIVSVSNLTNKTISCYNENGRLLQRDSYYRGGDNWDQRWLLRYDVNGNKIEDKIIEYPDKIWERTGYRYDKNNNLVGWDYYQKENLTTTASYRYNEKGLLVEKTYKNAFGYSDNFIYNYYSNKQLIQTIIDDASIGRYMDLYTYDEYGNRIEWTRREGRLLHFICRESYEYDTKNRLLQTTRYHDERAGRAVTAYSYDDKGNLIGEISYSDLKKLKSYYKIVYQNDESGNKIKMLNYYTARIIDKESRQGLTPEEFLIGWTDYKYEFYPK